ncbi:hypothetical protein D3C81_1251840 [compost metagenome]
MNQHRPYRVVLLQEDECLKSDADLILQCAVHLLQLVVALLADLFLDQGLDALVIIQIQCTKGQQNQTDKGSKQTVFQLLRNQ